MQKYPGAFTLLGFSLSHYLLFPDFWDNLTFVRFGGYTIIIASAYLKKQLLFYLFYFPIGLVYMVLFGKASGFLIFMHVSVYFYV